MHFHIGIGSWADPAYKKLLVAPGVAPNERLRAYAAWFDHVEVNASNYRIPSPKQTAGWVEQTPAGFTFDLRLHKFFSEDPERTATDLNLIARMLDSARPLSDAGRFGCFLLVLPPSFTPAKRRLEELDALAAAFIPHALAVELRHRDWVSDERRPGTLAFFRERQIAWVAVDMPRIADSKLMPPVDEVTRGDLAYLRLHGRNPDYAKLKTAEEKHTYAYCDAEIAELAERARALGAKAQHVRVIANNHAQDLAPKTALALQRLLRPGRAEPVM